MAATSFPIVGMENLNKQRNVRDGSEADAEAYSRHVLFSSNSGHSFEGSARLKELSQERLPERQRQSAQNCLQAASRFGRDRTSPISTRKSPGVRGLRDSIRDFGD